MELDLGHVRSFLAVVDYGGYHRAAEALHLTQPAVSQHVRRLEQRIGGGPLFERRGRGVQVSGRGDAVAAELRELLRVHDRAVAHLSGARPFVLGVVEHFVDPLIPRLLAAVDRDVQLRVERSHRLVEGIASGDVDAAIVMDPGGHPDPRLVGEVVLRWHAATDASLSDPLAVVAYTAPCALRGAGIRRLETLGIETFVAAESSHLSGVQTAVRNGLGVALLAAGADGVRPIEDGPLAEPYVARLWLVANEPVPELAEALRNGLARSRA